MNRAIVLLLVLVGLLLPQGRLAAQPSTGLLRPKRLVHLFDFEERGLGNYEDLPMHWYVIGRPALTSDPNFHRQPVHQALIRRPGFPAFTDVRFDTAEAASGQHSFYFGLNGGSAGAFLEIGTLAAVPNSDYLVSVQVKTRDLDRASARLIAYFLDAQGRIIDASRTASEPIGGTRGWETLSVKLPGEFSEAAWLGLELEVNQPLPSPDNPLGRQQVVLQDVRGGAWFDDITVWQLPHVDLASQSPVGIVRGPDKPHLNVDVRDLTGRRLRAELKIYDHTYRVIDATERAVGAGAPMNWRWEPKLEAYGWHLVDLKVHEDARDGGVAGVVARMLAAVLWLPPETPLAKVDRQRFAISAEGASNEELALVPDLLEAADLHEAVLSAWGHDTTPRTMDERQDTLDDALRRILTAGGAATVSLHPIPKALAEARGIEARRPLAVLQGDRSAWLPYLAPVLMRQGQRVRQWQLGAAHQPEAFFQPDLSALLATVERDFRGLAPKPQLYVPWHVNHERRPELPAESIAAIHVPASVPAEALTQQVEGWRGTRFWLYLDEPPADEVLHADRAADLALRMVHGWEAGALGMTLPKPWTPAADDSRSLWPDPLLGVFTNVARHLAGRRVIGHLPLRDGLQAVIFDGEGGGMIAAWARGSGPRESLLDLYLGGSPVAHDIWGNTTTLRERDRRHPVQLGKAPLFITGIDAELALLRSSFRVESAFVESAQRPHDRTVIFRNPWSRTINGHMQFTGPEAWSIQPLRHTFSLSPGQELRLPVQIKFPFAELAGQKDVTAKLEFTADRHYVVDLATPIELGLTDLEFDATVALHPTAKPGVVDAELLCVITNSGTTAKTLSLFAQMRTQPRQDRTIGNLQPGQSIIRRFRFEGLTAEDRQSPLRTGIRELSGPAVLNRTLDLQGAH